MATYSQIQSWVKKSMDLFRNLAGSLM